MKNRCPRFTDTPSRFRILQFELSAACRTIPANSTDKRASRQAGDSGGDVAGMVSRHATRTARLVSIKPGADKRTAPVSRAEDGREYDPAHPGRVRIHSLRQPGHPSWGPWLCAPASLRVCSCRRRSLFSNVSHITLRLSKKPHKSSQAQLRPGFSSLSGNPCGPWPVFR